MERIGRTDEYMVLVTMTEEEFRAAHAASVAVAARLRQMALEIEAMWPESKVRIEDASQDTI